MTSCRRRRRPNNGARSASSYHCYATRLRAAASAAAFLVVAVLSALPRASSARVYSSRRQQQQGQPHEVGSSETTITRSRRRELQRDFPYLVPDEDTLRVKPAIVGGTPAGNAYPSYVSSSLQGAICGGTLIHEDIVLTAAHCQSVFIPGAFVSATGIDPATGFPNGQSRGITQEIIHPQFVSQPVPNFVLQFDYMLIKLDSPVTDVVPSVVNADAAIPAEGAALVTLGMGRTSLEGPQSNELLMVDINVANTDRCTAQLRDVTTVRGDIMICAGGEGAGGTGKNACDGDSGGPLFDAATGNLVGVTSFRTDCNQFPAVWARLSPVAGWIQQQVCEASSNPPPSCGGGVVNPPPPLPATPAPVAVVPATPAPVAVPATPAPVPIPVTPAPVVPIPVTPAPVPIPVTPVPIPVTPVPIPVTPVPIPVTPVPIPVTPAPVPIPVTPVPIPVTPAPVPIPATPVPVPIPVTPAPVAIPVTPAPVAIPVTPAPVAIIPATQAPVMVIPATPSPIGIPVTMTPDSQLQQDSVLPSNDTSATTAPSNDTSPAAAPSSPPMEETPTGSVVDIGGTTAPTVSPPPSDAPADDDTSEATRTTRGGGGVLTSVSTLLATIVATWVYPAII